MVMNSTTVMKVEEEETVMMKKKKKNDDDDEEHGETNNNNSRNVLGKIPHPTYTIALLCPGFMLAMDSCTCLHEGKM